MKKTIKYLQNGEYHYATVKDVGDIDLLKTSNKDDLVSAINEIIVNGVSGGGGISQDQLDKINSDILGVSADIAAKYSELQGKISDGDAMQASLRAQAIKDINGAIAAANAAIEEYKKANEEAVKATQADIDAQNNRIDRINEQADALRTDLATAQTDLTQTKTDLSNATLDFGKVKKTVVDLENEVSTKLSNTDLDPLNQKIQSVESNVKQTKDELSQYVKHDEYDLTTGEVNKIKSNVQQLADRVETKVSRDTLNDDINEFVVKKANLLVQTRDWSIIDNVGWTFSNDGLIAIQAELYDHAHVLEIHQTGVYAEQTIKGLHGGQSYTVSVSAKTKDAASGVNITLVGNDKTLGIMRRVKTHDTDISTEYERYEYTLVAPSDTLVLRFIATGMASSNVLYLYKAKLEEGTKSYEWEMNVNDIYAKVEKNSAKFTTYDDRITGVVTKQRDFGTWKEQAQSTITQTADGLKINNQKLKSVDGDVVDVIQSKINASAEKLTSNYEKFTNQQVGMIVDEGTNQILNSAFTYYDLDSKDVKKRSYTFDSWQNISAKATIKSINKVNWAHMAQSGLSNDNPISITSNTFPVKQGKVIVGVDVLTPNVRAIDNQKVLVLQFYDDDGTRVDYREVSLHDLGLDTIQSNVSKRGTYRVGIDRKDVTKMTILARLPRNGEINFTNFFAKVSSLDNGDYQPNPADLQQQTIKQQTAIEQTADTIRQKADQTTVDTLNGTVQRQGTLIEQNAQHIQLKADGTTVTALSNKTDELSQLVSKHSASLEVTDKAITQQASAISSVTTIANGANSKIDNLSFGGRNLLNGSSTLKIVGQADSDVRNGTWRLSNQGNSTPLQNVTNELPPGVGVTNAIKISPLTGAAQDRASLSKGTYTFSVWLKGTAGMKYTLQPFWNLTATYGSSPELTLQTSDWDRVSFTVDLKTDESVISTAYVYNHDKTNVLYMAAPQLEKASRPSDYSLSQNDLQRLASENTASQISQYNTGTVQPIKGIANDALGKANNANNKIDGLRIGGRNLLKGTSDQLKTMTASGWMNAHTYSNYPYVDLSNFHTGDYLTYSVWVTNTSDVPIRAEIYCFDKNKAHTHTALSAVINPNNSSWLVVTMPIEVNDWYARPSVITTSGQTGSHTIRMREEMLTLGNVKLPWQPSDLDLPDTIVSTVTTTTNAKQIVDNSGIYSEVTKLVDTKVGGVATQLETYKHTVDDTGDKLKDVMSALKLDSNGNLTSNFNELIKTASGVEERYTQLNGKIDGLKVGGRNYLRESWVTNRNAQSATYDSNTKTWTVKLTAGGGDVYSQGLRFTSAADRNLVIPYGQTAIISMEIKPEYNCQFGMDINNYPMSGSAWTGNDNDNRGESVVSPGYNLIGGQWNKISYTVANTSPKNTNKVDIYDSQSNFGIRMKSQSKAQTVYIRYIMWELGTVAGNYYPALEDTDATIQAVTSRVTTAEGTITQVKKVADGTKSIVTQLSNLFGVNVGDSSISVTNNGVLVKGKQVHIDGQTVIDNASIDGAKIKSLDAGKITTGTLEGVTLKSVNSSGSLVNIGNGIIKFGYETGGRGAEFGQINAYNNGLMLSGQDPQYTGIYLPNSIDSAIGFYTNRDGSTGYNNGIGIQGNTIGRVTLSPRVNQPHVSSPILSFEDSTLRLNVGNHGLTINGKLELGNNYIFSTDEFSIDNPAGVFRPVGWRFWGNALDTHGPDLWVNAYGGSGGNAVVHARGFANTSLLSKKTDITKVTTDEALSAIRDTEIYSYYYIDDLKKGKNKRYASYVIDDVNAIKQYHEPDIFLSEDGTGRDDGTQLAYVTVATQYLLKQNQTVSEFTNTGENGTVKVLINAQDANYRVNLTPYGNGYAWVDERNEEYFIVKSNVRNLEVLYEIRGV